MHNDFLLNIRYVLHNNPGQLYRAELTVKTDQGNTRLHSVYFPSGITSPEGTLERWLSLPVDIHAIPVSGRQTVTLRIWVKEPDGNRMKASLNFPTHFRNGKPLDDRSSRNYIVGQGWYTNSGYCETDYRSDKYPLPDAPVSAFSPKLRIRWHGLSSDLKVSRHTVRLDANVHAGIPGTVVREGPGELPEQTVSVPADVGKHKLLERAECDDPRGSTNAGVLVIPFEVAG